MNLYLNVKLQKKVWDLINLKYLYRSYVNCIRNFCSVCYSITLSEVHKNNIHHDQCGSFVVWYCKKKMKNIKYLKKFRHCDSYRKSQVCSICFEYIIYFFTTILQKFKRLY